MTGGERETWGGYPEGAGRDSCGLSCFLDLPVARTGRIDE